jgi:hypothetical protein
MSQSQKASPFNNLYQISGSKYISSKILVKRAKED